MKPKTHHLGIRHHGVGSAKRLLSALEALRPDAVLIEGPADCTDLLAFLAQAGMRPPVSLLAYHADNPDRHVYYPFTMYSPEYQAVLWALEHDAEVALIDIATDIQLADVPLSGNADESQDTSPDEATTAEPENQNTPEQTPEDEQLTRMAQDPIGLLAECAGYQDGESWWNDHFEQSDSDDSLAVFAQVADAMSALRDSVRDEQTQCASYERNEVREAYMRLQIHKHIKALEKSRLENKVESAEQPLVIAVVCGAWHVPALRANVTQKADRATIKALPKKLPPKKIKRTWIPWTSNRLSRRSGYGAGVPAPMWYQHLWDYRGDARWLEFWVGKIARAMRDKGHVISTASVIEAVRLSHNLATIRGRPQAGFEEIIDAVIACLCFGEAVLWRQVADDLLLGHAVGHIPDNLPLAPLLEDLQRQQKATKIKAEALPRDLPLDLRSDSGSKRSVLLHRLNLLDVAWGELQDSGRSRGTFRENWRLEWKPEFSVQLVENLVYGNSIEQAANNKMIEALHSDLPLNQLAEKVQVALTSALGEATHIGLARLDKQAVHDTDVVSLLATLPHLVQISRYGTARQMDLGKIDNLTEKLVIQSALALPLEAVHLSEEEAERYRDHIQNAHHAVMLAELDAELMQTWWQALTELAESNHKGANGLLVGMCNRLLYQGEKIDTETVEMRLRYALSPAVPVAESAQFFDGFFSDAVSQLHYDKRLLKTVNDWILQLDEADFMTCLPLFMRTFSSLDKTERQRLLTVILGREAKRSIVYNQREDLLVIWGKHLQEVMQ